MIQPTEQPGQGPKYFFEKALHHSFINQSTKGVTPF